MIYSHTLRQGLLLSVSFAVLVGTAARAQNAPNTVAAGQGEENAPANVTNDIIVTARKRDETSLQVPVVLTAVSGAELERRAIVSLDGLTRMVPQLQLGSGGGTIQGGNIGIRGVAGSDSNPFADQAVSFNLDGVQVSRSNIRRMAELDTAQVEVLKGPQALFFGKNSPGGIISIRSADPTSHFEAKASAGYEFYAHEVRGDGYISGPITDTLGARLAVYGSTERGWFDNDFADTSIYAPADKHTPKSREFAVRGTLKWEPTDRFNARLKMSFNKLKDAGILTSQERVDCPLGAPALGGGPDDCKLDGRGARRDLGPLIGTIAPRFGDGVPYLRMQQALISYEMNYDLSDELKLTSVTGYYYLRQRWADNFNLGFTPSAILPSAGFFGNKEFSQEVRLTSSLDGPLNVMFGGFYQNAHAYVGAQTFRGAISATGGPPPQLNNYRLVQHGQAYSVFGQLIIRPLDVIEVDAGGRYSYEQKQLPTVLAAPATAAGAADYVVIPATSASPRRGDWSDFSPEFTVSYRPTNRLTFFASYKQGFLSGGFNSGASSFAGDLRYDQQKIKGFEGGVKALLFNGTLRTNLSAYSYKITGLQVTTSTTGPTGVPVQTVLNAGKTTLKGVEFDFNYTTPLKGLSLHGALGYNHANYDVFSVGCYAGQTQAMGCNYGLPNVAGVYSLQNLAGRPLLRAPRLSGTAGFGYESDVGSALKFGLGVDATYSSGYFTDVTESAASFQRRWALLDATARLARQDDGWEIAVIGRNLTNKYYLVRTVDTPLTGSGTGTTVGVLADTQGAVNRGREVMIRLTWKYGAH